MIIDSLTIKSQCEEERKKGSEGKPLIVPFDDYNFEGNPAKIELHIGKNCYCSSNSRLIIDLEIDKKVTIPPNEILFFETFEKINMPTDMSGRMGLKMGLVSKGLLMPSQTQVDPGYSNQLFGMLYNLSSQAITLEYKQAITTLEVSQTNENPSIKYSGKMDKMTFAQFVANRVTSSLGSLEKDVKKANDDLKASTSRLNVFVTSFSVAIAVITVLVAVMTVIGSFKKDADIAVLEKDISSLQETVESQKTRLEDLEASLAAATNRIDDNDHKAQMPMNGDGDSVQ